MKYIISYIVIHIFYKCNNFIEDFYFSVYILLDLYIESCLRFKSTSKNLNISLYILDEEIGIITLGICYSNEK